MGLGSLVGYRRPVMENEYHYNAAKAIAARDAAAGAAAAASPTQLRNGLVTAALHGGETIRQEGPSQNGQADEHLNKGALLHSDFPKVNGNCSVEKGVVHEDGDGEGAVKEARESLWRHNGEVLPREVSKQPRKDNATLTNGAGIFESPALCNFLVGSFLGKEFGSANVRNTDGEKLNGKAHEAERHCEESSDRWDVVGPSRSVASRHSAIASATSTTEFAPFRVVSMDRVLPPLRINVSSDGTVGTSEMAVCRSSSHSRLPRGVTTPTFSTDINRFPSPTSQHARRFGTSQSMRCEDDGLHVPSEETLNQALQFFKLSEPTVSASTQSSAVPSPSSKRTASSCPSPSRVKEVVKRKTMQERLKRLWEQKAPVSHSNTTQQAILLRRFKKQLPVMKFISEELYEHVLNDDQEHTPSTAPREPLFERPTCAEVIERAQLRAIRMGLDPDATDSESDDEVEDEGVEAGRLDGSLPSTSASAQYFPISRTAAVYRYYKERVEMCAKDELAAFMEEDTRLQIDAANQKLAEMRGKKQKVCVEEDDDGLCARCRPFDGTARRKLHRPTEANLPIDDERSPSLNTKELVERYSRICPDIHPDISSLSGVSGSLRCSSYLYWKGTRPEKLLRKRWDTSPWISACDDLQRVAEDATTNRKRRKDDDDSSVELTLFRKAPRSSYRSGGGVASPLKLAGKRLVKRSLVRRRNGERRLRRSKSGRQSAAPSVSSVSHAGDLDDSFPDSFLGGFPQKIDYKEICIPRWRIASPELGPFDLDSPCAHAEYSTPAEISRRHLPLELNERKRFQQYRDYVASKAAAAGGGMVPPSKLSGVSVPPSKMSSAASSKLSGGGGSSSTVARSVSAESVSSSGYSPRDAGGGMPSPAVIANPDDELSNAATEFSVASSTVTPDCDRSSVKKPFSPRTFPLPPALVHAAL